MGGATIEMGEGGQYRYVTGNSSDIVQVYPIFTPKIICTMYLFNSMSFKYRFFES